MSHRMANTCPPTCPRRMRLLSQAPEHIFALGEVAELGQDAANCRARLATDNNREKALAHARMSPRAPMSPHEQMCLRMGKCCAPHAPMPCRRGRDRLHRNVALLLFVEERFLRVHGEQSAHCHLMRDDQVARLRKAICTDIRRRSGATSRRGWHIRADLPDVAPNVQRTCETQRPSREADAHETTCDCARVSEPWLQIWRRGRST